jgi:hypothetical protein
MKSGYKPEIKLLLNLIDQAFDKKSWHGTNLRGALKGLTIEQLIWRPQQNRHNIWGITVHCAYWKYVVLRNLVNLPRGSFPRKPSNFPSLPEKQDKKSWQSDLDLLKKYHVDLRDAITALSPSMLNKRPPKSESTYLDLIQGIASHDLYHAGQIQLIKRMYAN